ncbi:hypothetical protein [Thermodesulfobacterium sp. TA1]|uniref:hypothetical protein n=1 Tax=Thermodesulfobacterium sp. TA1 TaxID=2234087 RepID=UPI00197E01DA|nr:hypothetical protein [Thermodesulfobacterium sp. TA1]
MINFIKTNLMYSINLLLITTVYIFLLTIKSTIASESPDTLNEETIKNFRYHLKYSGQTVTLKNGEYKTQLRPGNEEDIKNYISVKIEKYGIFKPNFSLPFAIVILSENFGGSGVFFEITALVNENGKIMQTNSIKLGDRVVVKDLKFQPGFVTFRDRERDSIYLSLLTHRETDPSCCPTKLETLCFTLVRDENKEMKLLTCEEADIKYPLPLVKKPAIYLYPTKTKQIEVYLNPKGWLTKTIPSYNGFWSVKANPKGIIDDKYEYLFYEVALNTPLDLPKEGWVVKTEELNRWFDKILPKLGLNRKEIKDFKDYWLKELKGYPYFKIMLLSRNFLDDSLAIWIKPKPDKIIRVILAFEGIQQEEKIKEPVIKTPRRKGFTVVEWGGILINELIYEGNNPDIKPYIEVKIGAYPRLLATQKVYCAKTEPVSALTVDGRVSMILEPGSCFMVEKDTMFELKNKECIINLLKGRASVSVVSEKIYVENKIKSLKEENSVVEVEVDDKNFPGLNVRIFFRVQNGPPIEVESGKFNLTTLD